MNEPILNELRQEAETTRRLLYRLPPDELRWRPHPRSMSLGQLALHVASIPGDLSRLAQRTEFDAANANFKPPTPESKETVMSALEKSMLDASAYVASLSQESADAPWRLTFRGSKVFAMPRSVMLRNLLLNHWFTIEVNCRSICGCWMSRFR